MKILPKVYLCKFCDNLKGFPLKRCYVSANGSMAAIYYLNSLMIHASQEMVVVDVNKVFSY